jgi:hypothetical protein
MTIRPAALNRRQPAVGSLLIVTIVVPAISLKGAKNQLRRETGVPGPTPLSAEWMEKGRAGVGPIVAGVSHRRSSESRLFSSPGRSGQTMTPHWPGRFFSDLEAQSTIQIHKPLPDPFKKGTIGAARENLPPVAGRRPVPVRQARRRNHQRRALCCCARTFAVSCLDPVRLGQRAVHAYG